VSAVSVTSELPAGYVLPPDSLVWSLNVQSLRVRVYRTAARW
jgi:hypothetical protein